MVLSRWFGRRSAPALVSVFLQAGRVFVQASDRTFVKTAGFWVGAGPVATLSVNDGAAPIGEAVLDALARSRTEVPIPERGVDLEAPLRAAAGVRSRRALMEGTRLCVVSRSERGPLRIEPHHNGGSSGEEGGYRPLGDAAAVALAAEPGPVVVGEAVIAALARATADP